MSKRAGFVKSARGFVATNKGQVKKKKMTHNQIRHDCLSLAYSLVLDEDESFTEKQLRYYENICLDHEKDNKGYDFKESLEFTIRYMTKNHQWNNEPAVQTVLNSAFARLEVMTNPASHDNY